MISMVTIKVDQPSRVCSPGAVGGVDLEGACLPSDEPVQLVKAGVLAIQLKRFFHFCQEESDDEMIPFTDCEDFLSHLIVMDPSDRVESCNLPNLLWQLVRTWPLAQ